MRSRRRLRRRVGRSGLHRQRLPRGQVPVRLGPLHLGGPEVRRRQGLPRPQRRAGVPPSLPGRQVLPCREVRVRQPPLRPAVGSMRRQGRLRRRVRRRPSSLQGFQVSKLQSKFQEDNKLSRKPP